MKRSSTEPNFWPWLIAAWLVIVILYTFPMQATQPGVTMPQALLRSVSHWLTPAVLCVGVWRLTAHVIWPPRSTARFVLAHLAAGIVFTCVWFAVDMSLISWGMGVKAAFILARVFEGFSLIDGLFFYALIVACSYAIRMVGRVARADSLRVGAELAALRGQLNPHFLFNTLHTLTALVRRDPATAEHSLERFGDMLRYVLDVKRSAREDVTLADELRFVRDYLSLEQLRLGDRLKVVERIDPETLDCILPSLTLQPLVENAIKYGIAPRALGGTIEIASWYEDDAVRIEIRDDGPGAPANVLDSAKGVGLRAVRQRLETRFDGQSTFAVTTAPGCGFVTALTLSAT